MAIDVYLSIDGIKGESSYLAEPQKQLRSGTPQRSKT
jgi:type VI protein secretion system component Hcp